MPEFSACLTLRDQPHYRIDAFKRGLEAVGWRTTMNPAANPQPGDVIVMWNRSPGSEMLARDYERGGATVIVAENGWIGTDASAHHLYSVCKGHHNGAGKWSTGPNDRWAGFGLHLTPWRSLGEDILVLPQRGIGERGVAMPSGWTEMVVRKLRQVTQRRIRVRPHPGQVKPPLEPDLQNVHAVVTWASGAAIKAIAAGVPCFYEMPDWIGAPAAKMGVEDIEHPFLGDRLPMFRRLAWAQWRVDEIARGEPFRQWWRG